MRTDLHNTRAMSMSMTVDFMNSARFPRAGNSDACCMPVPGVDYDRVRM